MLFEIDKLTLVGLLADLGPSLGPLSGPIFRYLMCPDTCLFETFSSVF